MYGVVQSATLAPQLKKRLWLLSYAVFQDSALGFALGWEKNRGLPGELEGHQ